jgi:hypothetical protein
LILWTAVSGADNNQESTKKFIYIKWNKLISLRSQQVMYTRFEQRARGRERVQLKKGKKGSSTTWLIDWVWKFKIPLSKFILHYRTHAIYVHFLCNFFLSVSLYIICETYKRKWSALKSFSRMRAFLLWQWQVPFLFVYFLNIRNNVICQGSQLSNLFLQEKKSEHETN